MITCFDFCVLDRFLTLDDIKCKIHDLQSTLNSIKIVSSGTRPGSCGTTTAACFFFSKSLRKQ